MKEIYKSAIVTFLMLVLLISVIVLVLNALASQIKEAEASCAQGTTIIAAVSFWVTVLAMSIITFTIIWLITKYYPHCCEDYYY